MQSRAPSSRRLSEGVTMARKLKKEAYRALKAAVIAYLPMLAYGLVRRVLARRHTTVTEARG
jgi:hypothetical protein